MISNDSKEKIRGIGLLAEHIICMSVSYEEPIEKFRKNPLYSPQFEDKENISKDIAKTAERISQEIKAVSTADLKKLNDEHGISFLEYIDMLNEAIKETPYAKLYMQINLPTDFDASILESCNLANLGRKLCDRLDCSLTDYGIVSKEDGQLFAVVKPLENAEEIQEGEQDIGSIQM